MRFRSQTLAHAAFCLGALQLVLSSCRMRPSSVPLGGVHVDEAELPSAKRVAANATPAALPAAPPEPSSEPQHAEPAPSAPLVAGKDNQKPLPASGAFEARPYAVHQAWSRLVDLEFELKVGPGGSVDMKMDTHQEVRFEVLGVSNGGLDKLAIEYTTYASKLSFMGATQESPEELAGKRFVVTFVNDKPEVRYAAGGTPPQKQLDVVKDDAREPIELEKALKELTQLAAKGRGDFSRAGAVSLAGGEDEDTKVPSARASLQQLSVGAHAEKTARLDLAYTLTNTLDDKSVIEMQVTGSVNVVDAPARVLSSTLQGPMELRAADAAGMQGRGVIKVTTSYKY